MSAIAFIGLGNMGAPMAMNLLKAGHQVAVFDLVPEAVSKLEAAGARAGESARDTCENADFVITMLPAGRHVESLLLGDDGLLDVLASSSVLIDSSTIDANTARKLASAAKEKGLSMMDAPVSGGVAGAAAGTLSFMCGGDESTFEQVKPILNDMGKNIFHAGGAGAGQVAKACNNMLLAIMMIGTSEALQLGQDQGLDPETLSNIMQASSGRNWTLELYNPCPGVMDSAPASKGYQPGFMSNLMLKDLGLAMAAAGDSRTETPLGQMAHELYSELVAQGSGEKDFSSIYESLQALARKSG